MVIGCTVLVCGVKHSVNLVKRNIVDNEEELISCDYSNDPRCGYSESLDHMLRSLGIKPWGIDAKSFPKEQENVTTKL